MNPKIDKLKAEREKNCTKISDLQSRNKVIDGQVMELENLDIGGDHQGDEGKPAPCGFCLSRRNGGNYR